MRKWAAFWALGLIWGSSFLLIRVGVAQISPFQVVFIRTGIAALGMNLVLLLQRKHLPFNLRQLVPLMIIGVGNTTIPFALITWGEKSIPSGIAAMLQSTASLFTLVLAHFFFTDERITRQKVVGLTVGFLGVIILASRSIAEAQANPVGGSMDWLPLLGALAVVVASLFYAMFTIYSRKTIQSRFEPIMVSTGAMTFAAISSGICMVLAPLLGGQAAVPLNTVTTDALGAVVWLGFTNTFVAYILFYWIVRELGAARTSMVTYVVPGVGLTLGAIVLHEVIDWRILVGAALIFSGIAIVNLRIFSRLPFRRSASVASEEAT